MSKLTCVRQAHRPELTYEDFLESRKLGFGGSDIGDLLDSEPYGCKRRLFLSRLGLLPIGNDRLAFHLERGKFFEGPVAGLYASRTGREVKETGTGYLKQFPFVRANADRLVTPTGTVAAFGGAGALGLGVLEIKVPAAWSFKKIKKEGLPEAYILQLQWQMLCYGTEWGSFAVYWPDGHELLWFDVARDNDLIAMLLERAKQEWGTLESTEPLVRAGLTAKEVCAVDGFPARKDEHYTGCANCPAFEMCHGKAYAPGVILDCPELEPTAQRYSELAAKIKGLEAERDELKSAMKDEFAKFPSEALTAGKFQITLREQTRESLDTAGLKKELAPEILVRYTKQTKYEVLTVKAQKEGKKK